MLEEGEETGDMAIRKGILLAVSALWAVAVFLGLYNDVAAENHQRSDSGPRRVGDTGLTAVSLAAYEGPFMEDGSGEEVVDVAALVLRNEAASFLCHASVTVETGEQTLLFEITALPPGATVLALEQSGQPLVLNTIKTCTVAAEFGQQRFSPAVTVEESGPSSLLVTNVTNRTLPAVTLRYKTFDPESDTYLGGITYTWEVHDLLPGESRTLTPPYYVSAHSQIVSIDT